MDLAAPTIFPEGLQPGPDFARSLDESDRLAPFRGRFELPEARGGDPAVYLVGNSLGPMPVDAVDAVGRVTERWSRLGVDGWFVGSEPWYELDERFLPSLAHLVGASPAEVAVLNGLTVNLHLLLATFFRPSGIRRKILIDGPCFPSDRFVVETQLRWHGLDPDSDLVEVAAVRDGDSADEDAIEEALAAHHEEIAIVLLGGVNFLTGRRLDVERLALRARQAGALIGVDLAHAAGNVPLHLHDWGVDFAAWCHYKYINAGPGSPAGIFVHERHGTDATLPRLGGWWGNDPGIRFRMQLAPDFVPRSGALGWQLSCPSALAMAPLGPALALFDEAGFQNLRAKSVRLTAYLEWLLDRAALADLEVLTPRDPERRGAQLSFRAPDARRLQETLQEAGIVGDFREPDVLRLAPAPLFNTFHEMWRTAEALRRARGGAA